MLRVRENLQVRLQLACILVSAILLGCERYETKSKQMRSSNGEVAAVLDAKPAASAEASPVPNLNITIPMAFEQLCPEKLKAGPLRDEAAYTVWAILDALDTMDCGAAVARLKTLDKLDLSQHGIRDLTPLKGLPAQLKTLDLRDNRIVDLSPLTTTYVEELWLGYNGISELGPLLKMNIRFLQLAGMANPDFSLLEKMPKLEYLTVNNAELADATVKLNEAPALRHLDLGISKISDLNRLDLPSRLESLILFYNNVTDISPLSRYKNLRALSLSINSNLSNIQTLSSLTELRNLALNLVKVSDFSVLKTLPKLEQLSLTSVGTGATSLDFSFLATLTNLKRLEIGDPFFADTSVISGLVQLETLKLSGTSVSVLGPLASLNKLKALELTNVPAANLALLEAKPVLESLVCMECGIASLSFLAQFPQLTNLILSSNSFTSLEGIQVLSKLKSLAIDQTAVTNLTALNALPALESLDLSEVRNVNFAQIMKPERIKSLSLVDAGLNSLQGLAAFTGLETLELAGNSFTDLTPLANLKLRSLTLDRNMALTQIDPIREMKSLHSLSLSNTGIRSVAALRDLRLYTFFGDTLPLGTAVGKTAENCPTTAFSKKLIDFCRAP